MGELTENDRMGQDLFALQSGEQNRICTVQVKIRREQLKSGVHS
jgi:hypothetical protein